MAAAPESPPAPPPASPSPPLLGFAEPVAEVPSVEEFLPLEEPEPAPPAAAEPVTIAALEPSAAVADPALEPEHAAEPEPEPEPELAPLPIRARLRDLPPTPAAPAAPTEVAEAPAPVMPARPQNLVGRLGRRLGDPATAPAPAVRHLTETPPNPPQQATDRAGRPSLPRNRRAHRRARVPAEIEIDGIPCTLIDVSIGGFAASGVPQIEPNAMVPVTIRLVIDGIEVGTQLSARIVYVTHGRSAGRFIDLSPSQMAFLRYIVTWRGESVGAVGTTTLLDAIAGGADRGFGSGAGDHADPEAKSRWWAGLIGKKVNPPR